MSKEADLAAVEFDSPATYLESGRILPGHDSIVVVRGAISTMALLGSVELSLSRDYGRSVRAKQPVSQIQIRAEHFRVSGFMAAIRDRLQMEQGGGYRISTPETWGIVTHQRFTLETFDVTSPNGALGVVAPYRGVLRVYATQEDRRRQGLTSALAVIEPGDALMATGDWFLFGSAEAKGRPHHSVLTEFVASRNK